MIKVKVEAIPDISNRGEVYECRVDLRGYRYEKGVSEYQIVDYSSKESKDSTGHLIGDPWMQIERLSIQAEIVVYADSEVLLEIDFKGPKKKLAKGKKFVFPRNRRYLAIYHPAYYPAKESEKA